MASPSSSSLAGSAGSGRSRTPDGVAAGAHWLFGRNRLDVDKRELVRDEHRVQLDERAFAVLTCLLRHAGDVVPRATLVAEAWPGTAAVNDSAVSKSMRRLRIALGNESGRTLVTVYGVGYRLTTPATLVPAGANLSARRSDANGVAMAAQRPDPAREAASHVPEAAAPPPGQCAVGAVPGASADRSHRHWHRRRPTVIAALLLGVLLAGWLLLGPVAR